MKIRIYKNHEHFWIVAYNDVEFSVETKAQAEDLAIKIAITAGKLSYQEARMKIKRAIHLMTALRIDYKWCGNCQTEGEVWHGAGYAVCSQCQGKGFFK